MRVLGYLLAATHYKMEELLDMEPERLDFLYFWVKTVEEERAMQFGKLIGTCFTAGEIRSWAKENALAPRYRDKDKILVPLALTLKPDMREGLLRLVGVGEGLALPKDYRKKKNEYVVDLGKVTPQEFMDFVKYKKAPKIATEPRED